ncbi:MAG: hypothetical protein E7214_06760 [Clostridium sp.]|nr:hypothetical protein [Clostridium sp.]
MDFSNLADFLEDNGLSEIKEIKSENNYSIIKFYYDFDKEELEAAKAYANEESDVEAESDEWYRDWYLSYLYDIAKDNVEDILEDMNEELGCENFSKILTNDASNSDYVKFLAVICDEDFEENLEDILNDYL